MRRVVVQVLQEGLPLGDVDPRHGHDRVVRGEGRGDPGFQLSGRGAGEGVLIKKRDAGGREVRACPHRCFQDVIARGVHRVNPNERGSELRASSIA